MTDDRLRACTKCGAWNPALWYFCGSCLEYAGESFPPLPPAPATPLPYPEGAVEPTPGTAPLAAEPVSASAGTITTGAAPSPPAGEAPVLEEAREPVGRPVASYRFRQRVWALFRNVLAALRARTRRELPVGLGAD